MREVRSAATPRLDPCHFGLFICASCLAEASGPTRVSHVLDVPVFGDQAKTEILIPAGRQSFHPGCLRDLLFRQIDELLGAR